MRKFLIKMLGFGSVVLLVAVMLDMMISLGLSNTDCYRYQTYSDIYKGNMKYDVLIGLSSNNMVPPEGGTKTALHKYILTMNYMMDSN